MRYNYGGATASTETDGIEITEEEEVLNFLIFLLTYFLTNLLN